MDKQGQLRASLRLHLASGVGAGTFGRLVETFGDPAAAVAAGPQQWRKVKGIGDKLIEALSAVTDDDVDAELTEADKCGICILCSDDEGYPAALKAIFDPPAMLYVRGRLEPADAVAVGIVGARRCTHYGLEQAERFGGLLGRAGFTVVSGGARGIDTAAHRGALAAGGRTVAVMGCGLATVYPPENTKLFDQIVGDDKGAIVSELPLKTDIRSGNFHSRNRIISGMSLGVLVIEAARRSGSLITARQAAEQGREVFALPGRVDSPTSAGTNGLIRDGAILASDLDDILEHLGEVGEKMGLTPNRPDEPAAIPQGLDETEHSLVTALTGGPLSLDELVRHTELDTGATAAAMTMLVAASPMSGVALGRGQCVGRPSGQRRGATAFPFFGT
jgi:DNA processing protein